LNLILKEFLNLKYHVTVTYNYFKELYKAVLSVDFFDIMCSIEDKIINFFREISNTQIVIFKFIYKHISEKNV
jgi:hypothetical protein